MSNINFRVTRKGYSADYQRRDGFGFERRYYRRTDVQAWAESYGWDSCDQIVPHEEWTVAEMLIQGGVPTPYRVTQTY